MPSLALQPAMWAVALVVGLTILIYHRMRIDLQAGLGVFRLIRQPQPSRGTDGRR